MSNFEENKTEIITRELFDSADAAPCRYDVFLSTDPGRVRSGNEDNFSVNNVYRRLEDPRKNLMGTDLKEPLYCAVFDGMGGEANGELASKLCAEVSALIYYEMQKGGDIDIDELVSRFVRKCHGAVIEMLDNSKAKRGGSTFVMTVFYNGLVYPYSLGDSRIYLYRDGTVYQLSNDQTLAMKKLRANIMTEEEALTSPDRHKLTAFLGVDVDETGVPPQIYQPFRMQKGEKLLLCSDGLYDMCSDPEIARLLANESGQACLSLVNAALANGGEDNVTCIVIERSK